MGRVFKLLLSVFLGLLIACPAFADPDYEALANAIYKAEGGAKTKHPYGILKRYKTTTSRQACINTCKHAYRDYLVAVAKAPQIASKGPRMAFLAFLANRYAPIGAKNDPTGLNRNWLKNVSHFYNGDV